jgi:hypothetical protein
MITSVGLRCCSNGRKRARPPAVVSPLMLALTTLARRPFAGQALFEQRHPAAAAGQAVLGRQAVADDQDALALGARRGVRRKAIAPRPAASARSAVQCASPCRRVHPLCR